METIVPPSTGLFELSIDTTAHSYLKDAARWAKFLAIVGFIFCIFFLLFALLAGSLLSDMFNVMASQSFNGAASIAITIIYAGLALLNFFPCLYLFNFAAKMQVALRDNDQEQLNKSFKNMRSFYRFVGVLMIICLCFWALALLGIVLQAKLMHAGSGAGI
jgi:hypothetical protein